MAETPISAALESPLTTSASRPSRKVISDDATQRTRRQSSRRNPDEVQGQAELLVRRVERERITHPADLARDGAIQHERLPRPDDSELAGLGHDGPAARHDDTYRRQVLECFDVVRSAPHGNVGSMNLEDLRRAERGRLDPRVTVTGEVNDADVTGPPGRAERLVNGFPPVLRVDPPAVNKDRHLRPPGCRQRARSVSLSGSLAAIERRRSRYRPTGVHADPKDRARVPVQTITSGPQLDDEPRPLRRQGGETCRALAS